HPERPSVLKEDMIRHAILLVLSLLLALPAAARREKLALRAESLELPGAPSAVVAADLNGDGLRDLAVVLAFTRWGEIGIEESVQMDDIEGLVEVLTVIPSLVDRREVRVFLGRPGGGFDPAARSLAMETSVLSLEAGPPGAPVVALTDTGLSALRLRDGNLSFEPLIEERPVLSGTGNFLPNLGLVKDLDGNGSADVLLPTAEGASVYLSGPEGLRQSSRLRFPLDGLQGRARRNLSRFHPLPEVRDVTGDKLPDLVLRHASGEWNGFRVLRNQGGGRFSEAVPPVGEFQEDRPDGPVITFFGDLDGDGRAEYVTQEEKGPGEDAGMRKEMEHAKRPKFLFRIHRSRQDLGMEPKPFQQFEAQGYAFDTGGGGESGEGEVRIDMAMPGGFQDLNGDGRMDLIALTLDFSMLQAVKVLTVKRISIGIDFHVHCQGAGAKLTPVPGMDLSGKFNLNLNNLQIGQISQFAGDFDGDGRADFTQVGRGKTVTIHRGRADCSYPAQPDLALQLREAPRDLALVQVRDLDGDELSDLLVIQPQKIKEANVTPPVRLDLYLSRGEV
ncbi:MAG TPA: VCBS repeat-containing protein, partial [Thermoanaerobaculia bacterium]|nr:VCBS repeat-containing protein [Thermoanaerobaculia bacterium]